MPFIAYIPKRFHPKSEKHIQTANAILDEYAGLGLDLTLRQLYYQFVARDVIPNTFKEYKKLQSLINDARLAGRIDWHSIEDRTRNLQSWPVQENPDSALEELSRHYREMKWETQPTHVEVWVEKDALLGVIEKACGKYQTPFFSCRGYTSQSEVWNSAQRLQELGKPAVILHLGDHDPSGVDMSRDIQDRMELFEAANVTVERIALTMDQIRAKNPPPNPAKITDSRAKEYIRNYGPKSWELDALDPRYIINLIETATADYVDDEKWNAAVAKEEKARDGLRLLSHNFDVATRFVSNEDAMAQFEYDEEDRKRD
jgi:hypothetical protein